AGLQRCEIGGDFRAKAGFDLIGSGMAAIPQSAPTRQRQRIGTRQRKIRACDMQMRQRLADGTAMGRRWPARPHAFEKSDDGGRPAGELADDLAVTATDW